MYEESLVSDIGRECLMEVGYKSRWWARCNHVFDKLIRSVGAGESAIA